MPEQLTKHPDVTLQALKSAGATCSEGAPQKILTSCPKERFCSLPGGEMCIYGLDQAAQMTQIKPAELTNALQIALPPEAAASKDISAMEAFAVGAVFIAGIALGRWWPRVRADRSS